MNRRTDQAGVTLLETVIAGGVLLVIVWGAIAAMTTYTKASATSRREIGAHTRGGRALDRLQRELMNSVVPDPNDGLQIIDKTGKRVPDIVNGQPVAVTGPRLRVTRRGRTLLKGSRIRAETVVADFFRDVDDENKDGRRDQLIRIETVGGAPRTTVLAEDVTDVTFRKLGLAVEARCTTRGAISGWTTVGNTRVPEYASVVRTLQIRPRTR